MVQYEMLDMTSFPLCNRAAQGNKYDDFQIQFCFCSGNCAYILRHATMFISFKPEIINIENVIF